MNRFVRLSEKNWPLNPSVAGPRRRRLLHTERFPSIVQSLINSAEVNEVKPDKAPTGQRGQRCFVQLRVNSEPLDVFFNSAGGYRAQYLQDPSLGNKANRFVIRALLPTILRTLRDRQAEQSFEAFVADSLEHDWAKTWIHQGPWIMWSRKDQRVLCVPTWQAELSSDDKRRRKLARWGALTPDAETRIVLKGGYLNGGGPLNLGKPASVRAREIHTLGFT